MLYAALQRLEYRGYDSSGIVMAGGGSLHRRRAVGKLGELGKAMSKSPLSGDCGIGHTRWATHGGVTEANAHPIMDKNETVALVHNGIIENHRQLRTELTKAGHRFSSDTDTEVLCHLFVDELSRHDQLLDATAGVLAKIEGAYAFAALSLAHPGQVAIARNASPLAVGIGEGANYIGSDAVALGEATRRVIFLKDRDYGVIRADGVDIRAADGKPAQREVVTVQASPGLVSKDGFNHFMEKEIREQPEAIAHTLAGMLDSGGAIVTGIRGAKKLRGALMLAAGTSHNAAMIGKYWFEDLADLPVVAEIASEFRYRRPSLRNTGLAVGISQSGESLDTLMALRHAAEGGVETMGIVNVPESSIARETDRQFVTRAGPEIGVASTKTFTAQLTVLLVLAAGLGRDRGRLKAKQVDAVLTALESLPRQVGEALDCFDKLAPVVSRLSKARSCMFLGRGVLYPLALEGALKLKEISYIHAEGFASGEMKHGPIALIEEGLPVIALVGADGQLTKVSNNLMEAKARGADVVALATESAADALTELDSVVTVPDCDPLVTPILLSIPAQILAYLTAVHKGTDVDQPRNLAKSVTVE